MYYDAHIHLLDKNHLIDAQKKGVSSFIINSTNPHDWDAVINLSYKIQNLYPCIGIHPWFINNIESNWEEKMENLLQKHPFLMVGEIGLDYLKPEKEKQLYIFKTCLELSQKYNRPSHIHVMKAWHDVLRILKKFPNGKFLFHQFNASADIIQKLRNFNAYFSVSSSKNISLIPHDRLLTETDAPSHNKLPCDVINFVETTHLNKMQLLQNFQNFITPFQQFIPLKEK